MKRVRGTKFPQSRPESVSAIRWWNRGNAFKLSAAFLPVLERTDWIAGVNSNTNELATWRDVIDYLVAQGDAQLQLKSSRSRRGFFVSQSVINLLSLEIDRIEEIFPQVEAAVEGWWEDDTLLTDGAFNTNPARKYVDAFFGPRDVSPNILFYLWSRIFLDWFGARVPFGFFQDTLFLPEVPTTRREVISLRPPFAATKQQGGAAAIPRRATPTPTLPVQTLADLEAALAAREHTR